MEVNKSWEEKFQIGRECLRGTFSDEKEWATIVNQ